MENNNDKRTSRASQTREKVSEKKKVWTPPSSLDAPEIFSKNYSSTINVSVVNSNSVIDTAAFSELHTTLTGS